MHIYRIQCINSRIFHLFSDLGITTECQDSIADVVFVLDSSASIWEPDFYRQLDFVENIAKQFKIGPKNTQVGIVTFGEYHTLRFHLNKYPDTKQLQKAIRQIRFNPGRSTNTGDAINYMAKEMFTASNGARDDVPRVAVVITDGESTDSVKTAKAARAARELGIHLFAIGVGKRFDRQELESIANEPAKEYVFTVDNYSALQKILKVFAVKTCQGILYIHYLFIHLYFMKKKTLLKFICIYFSLTLMRFGSTRIIA